MFHSDYIITDPAQARVCSSLVFFHCNVFSIGPYKIELAITQTQTNTLAVEIQNFTNYL